MEMRELLPALADIESSGKNLLELRKYFPDGMKIYEYNPTDNKIIKIKFLSDDIKEWLRRNANYKFIFQCLLCHQEMDFKTAFCRGDDHFNRSHLLTSKHKRRVAKDLCIGLLYLSTKKFIFCYEKDFNNGTIFQFSKTIRRNPLARLNFSLKNQVFCSNYTIFSFDRQTRTLSELEIKLDMVLFMREYVRPLFKFHCLICNIQASNYTLVISHLTGKKHARKLGGGKGAIIAIRDFNIFLSCDLKKLTSFIFLDHLNSCLEEIVIASEGSIIISGCHSLDMKRETKKGEITVHVNPIKLPDGEIKDKSIKIKTRYNDFLTDSSEEDCISNQLSFNSPSKQKNVTIYEFSCKNYDEDYMDNILYAYFCSGCKIWCSRCRKGIYSLQALESHLSSSGHNNMIRGNEQVGFMCHFCNIFFIEFKGDSLSHIHSSHENKNILKNLKEKQPASIDYNTPLNKCVINVYARELGNVAEACKFSCLSCYDVTKQKLMYLGHHEISEFHRNLKQKCIFAYCHYCNVIYIDDELGQLKFHFASHLTEINNSITFNVHDLNGVSVNNQVDNSFLLHKNIFLSDCDKPIKCHKLPIRFSKYFIQLLNPGISNEFADFKNMDNIDFIKYLEIYKNLTGKEVKLYSCLTCDQVCSNKTQMISHLFISEHQNFKPFTKESFLKICDLCNMAIISENLNDLQSHFTKTGHLDMFSKKIGISSMFSLSIDKKYLNWLKDMSKRSLINIISSTVDEMKATFKNRNKIFNEITQNILALLSKTFPQVTVSFYGSQVSGLATAESDFDIFLNIGNDHLQQVKNLFKTENNYFELIVCLSEISTPILRAKHKASGAICDINLEYCEIKPQTSKLIKMFTDIDERVLWLLAAVRYWASATNLKNTNMFSSQAITWLVLFYLMQPELRIIPNVSYVMEHCGDLNTIKDENLNSWKIKHQISKDKTWINLLEGFFNYYSLMKFSMYKLIPSSGSVIPRNIEIEENRPMFMMDPLDNARNILYNATKEKSEKLTAACYLSLHMPWRWLDN